MNAMCKREPKRSQSVLPARKCRKLPRGPEPDVVDYMNNRNISQRLRDGFALAGITE